MVKHLAYCLPNQYGGHNYGTVCGLENRACKDDGRNTTDKPDEVTCKKCLAIINNPNHWRHKKYIKH
jgi:hypothetical protein